LIDAALSGKMAGIRGGIMPITFEHFALNVPDSVHMAEWYVAHLGMKVVMSLDEEPYTRFLADETGRVVMEIYSNKTVPIPEYHNIHPLNLHRGFAVADADATKARLLAAGAAYVEEARPPDGSVLYMLRDPWGVPLQICRRARPFGV
jgi:catechol 2,3-dioxygenase-like lactoylglutathione lyase family enzyme